MKVSSSHNYISTIGQFYSEEMNLFRGLRPNQIWGREVAFSAIPYEEHIHIDATKMRLFSPCSKECAGKDEPNPAIGKAFSVQGMLAWLAGDFAPSVPIFSTRWERRFKTFLPEEEYLKYLPRFLGGLAVPCFHKTEVELKAIFKQIPIYHLRIIRDVVLGVSSTQKRRCLSRFCTNVRARGLVNDEIENQIRDTLSNIDLVKGVNDPDLQFMTGKDDLEWGNLRYRDKVHIAKAFGFISVDDAISILNRPYTFRNLLAPEISAKHGIQVVEGSAYTALPWSTQKRKFDEDLILLEQGPARVSDEEFDNLQSQILSTITVTRRSIDVQKEVYFLPESVLLDDTMCTLRTPL
jgi:hypothetical protein